MTELHLSTARKIMQKESFSISFLTAKGECRHIDKAVSLKWDYRTGTRTIKVIDDRQRRPGSVIRIRDVLITEINDTPVYL